MHAHCQGAPKVLPALKKDTSAHKKIAQRDHVTAPTAESSVAEEAAKVGHHLKKQALLFPAAAETCTLDVQSTWFRASFIPSELM